MSALVYGKEGVLEQYELAKNVTIPIGEYSTTSLMTMISSPYSKPLSMNLTINGGEYYDGNMFAVTAMPVYNISSSLQLSGTYSYNKINFDVRNQQLISHIARLKVMYMFSTKLSLSSFVQYNSGTGIS